MTASIFRRASRTAALTAAALLVSVGVTSTATAQSALPNGNDVVSGSVLGAHSGVTGSLNALPGEIADPAKQAVDSFVNSTFPGVLPGNAVEVIAEPAPAQTNTPRPSGCDADAKACVDLSTQTTWLQNGGTTFYGAVRMASGKPGYETPRGVFYVNRKVRDEISYEFGNAPMPYAVYFTYNGIAFHQGDPAYLSHGCIRMDRDAAITYYNNLQIGDKVHVF